MACHLKPSQTFIDAQLRASCRLYHRLVWQLHRPQPQGSPEGGAVCTTHYRGQTTYHTGHIQHLFSQEGQKDHQGQQPPEALPVHPATTRLLNPTPFKGCCPMYIDMESLGN